jgi:hypothetical protein
MKISEVSAPLTPFNPFPRATAPGHNPAPPTAAPLEWHLLSEQAADAIWRAITAVVRELPEHRRPSDYSFLSHRARHRLVVLHEAGDTAAAGALRELQSGRLSGGQLLQAAIAKLIEAGGELAWEEANLARSVARIRQLKALVQPGETK